jgi:hypothetical protein
MRIRGDGVPVIEVCEAGDHLTILQLKEAINETHAITITKPMARELMDQLKGFGDD